MDIFENIKDDYILCNADLNFSVGTRSNLRYSCEYLQACLMELNPHGIDPLEYLNFAKSDISTNDVRGAINGLGNAKKAIHLTIVDSASNLPGNPLQTCRHFRFNVYHFLG